MLGLLLMIRMSGLCTVGQKARGQRAARRSNRVERHISQELAGQQLPTSTSPLPLQPLASLPTHPRNRFFGTSIQVYGTLSDPASNTPFTASFKIDDQSPISYTPSTQFEGLVYKTRFFQSSVLEEGEHTLVITDTTENASEFILVSRLRRCDAMR